jgi:Flp pilus assembly pilin Flp
MNPSPLAVRYVSAHSLARFVKILLIAGAIVGIFSMLTSALELAFPQISGQEELAENPGGVVVALLAFGLGVLTFLIFLTTVVFFLMWLYRCCKNLPAFGTPPSTITYTPGWAVGSFFIPFANLVIPYRAIKELWQKSVPASSSFLGETSLPAWFPLWWTFWLLSNVANNIYFRVAFNENVSHYVVAGIGVASDALTVIAAILAVVIVGEIDKRQEAASNSLSLPQFPSPPLPPPSFGTTGVAPMG